MKIRGAREHNLNSIDLEISDRLTAVTGVSGSGKSSLVFDTIYHESKRRFLDAFGTPGAVGSLQPAAVDSIEDLAPAIAVGQNLANRNPESTVATASGLHPFLRILYARFGTRYCPGCGESIHSSSEDEIARTIHDRSEEISIAIPLVRASKGSHTTFLKTLIREYGYERIVIDGNLVTKTSVSGLDPSAKHDIDLKVEDPSLIANSIVEARKIVDVAKGFGATAVTIGSGVQATALSFAPVCPRCGRWFGALEPKHFHQRITSSAAASTEWRGRVLDEFLCGEVSAILEEFRRFGEKTIARRLNLEISRRLSLLADVGLGYLSLDRPIPTLSRGEAQRLRIAVALVSPLEDMLHVLDEPTIGQHPDDVKRFLPVLASLPGPVIFVEHDRETVLSADSVIDIGIGAGENGGDVVFAGPPGSLLDADTPTGRAFQTEISKYSRTDRINSQSSIDPSPAGTIECRGASLRILDGFDLSIPIGAFTVVTGVSGSGKSTLVADVLYASIAQNKCVGCESIEYPGLRATLVDQAPIGKNPRSNPATYTKIADAVRDLFALRSGFGKSLFTCNREEGACPACGGLGSIEISMRYLPSHWIECADCGGRRFNLEARSVLIDLGGRRFGIDEIFTARVDELRSLFVSEIDANPPDLKLLRKILRLFETLSLVGLGYLPLGQPSPTLSGGEAQRIKLAKYLGKSSLTNLFVLDEPSTGLHSDDITRLIDVLRALCNTGATVIAIEHNRDFIRAADWNVELGPGAGPDGGRLIYAGPVEAKSVIDSTRSGDPSVIDHAPPAAGALGKPAGIGTIEIRGAVANNLDRIDLDIKKGELCVITGRSGSGKSSLVHDVLEVESRRRYLESLSLYERQSVSERSGNKVSRVGGIGVTMSFGTRRFRYSPRDDVARITGIGLDLASLYSRLGRLPGEEADHVRQTIGPSQFLPGTYSSACPECHGVGTQLEPAPSKLIVDPELPICGGAMHSPGFFPKGYICKPYNGGYYLVRALGECFGFDPETTRWSRMSEEARQAFLFGTERPILVRYENRKGVVSEREQQFPGFYGWIRDWDVGGTFTNTVPCPGCSGAGFRESILRVELGGWSIHRARTATFGELRDWIDSLSALELRSDSQSKRDAERLGSKLLFLANVGLSYLTSTQAAHSLSAGESQRLRLAGLLGSGLGSMTIILDEPTRGMHPQEIDGLIAVLLRLVDERNTVIVVEHDMSLIGAADTIIELGPGSGRNGGRIVANGTLSKISTGASVTGRALRGEISFPIEHSKLSNSTPRMIVRGARSNNLMSIDVEFPLGRITAVCGVSGSGKSTLVVDTLAMALSPRKQTTSVAYEPTVPGEHDSIDGAPGSTVLIDQSRAGVQHPGAYLGIEAAMQRHYLEVASEAGYESRDLKRDCSGCGGSGIVKTDMGFLPPIHQACEACDGSGYSGTALEFRVRGFTLAEIGRLTIDEVAEIYYDSQRIAALTEDASSIGLGYLSLRQPSHALSGGELQRLKIAKQLSRAVRGPTLYILDEPTVGLHLADVAALVKSLYALRKSGGTVIVVEHHPNMIAACDWIVELGPGGGPDGGTLVFEGDPEEFIRAGTATSPYVAEVLG